MLKENNHEKDISTEEMETDVNITDLNFTKNDSSSAIPSITLVKDKHLEDLKNNSYNHLYSNAALNIVAESNSSSFEKPAQMLTEERTLEVVHSLSDFSKENPAKSKVDLQNEAKRTKVRNVLAVEYEESDSGKENLAKSNFNQYFNQYLETLNYSYPKRRVVKSAESECQFPILASSKEELSKQLTHKTKLRSEAINHQIIAGQKRKNDVIDELWKHYEKYHSEDLATFECNIGSKSTKRN